MNGTDFPQETIAAISTAPGEGGIGIVRISGSASFFVLGKIFRPGALVAEKAIDRNGSGTEPLFFGRQADVSRFLPDTVSDMPDRRMRHGFVIDDKGRVVDEVLAVFMKGPKTYTGEDCAEIHCHGSMMALRKTLELAMAAGAEPAVPGEFTKRAFLNGRLDLAQAEAVIDLIKAKTEIAYNTAVAHLDGTLSAKIADIRESMLEILVKLVVDLDYPEEDEPDLSREEVVDSILAISDELDGLAAFSEMGRIIHEGLKTVIVGKPNVGKSSLLNALLKEARAIVTEIPGTTRDTIEELLNIRGIPVRLTDTAGIRDTEDRIERMGVERSKEAFNGADLVIFMIDISVPLEKEDRDIARHLGGRPVIAVLNKSDLREKISQEDITALLPQAEILRMSVKEGDGLAELEKAIEAFVFKGKAVQQGDVLLTSVRHMGLLEQAREEARDALAAVESGGSFELAEFNLRRAYEFLGGIIGEAVGDDIIEEVFSRFCLGK